MALAVCRRIKWNISIAFGGENPVGGRGCHILIPIFVIVTAIAIHIPIETIMHVFKNNVYTTYSVAATKRRLGSQELPFFEN